MPPFDGAHFVQLNERDPVVIRAFPGLTLRALSQVQLYIARDTDGRWWDFDAQQWQTNVLSRNYTVKPTEQYGLTLAYRDNLPSGTNLLNGDYEFIVRVINNADIPTEIRMTMTAAHAPEVSLSLVDNSVVNNLTNFTAFASEKSGLGVQRIEVALYWDGLSFEGRLATRGPGTATPGAHRRFGWERISRTIQPKPRSLTRSGPMRLTW